ncbi:hypothetical protein GCM10008915_35210 [Bifidobacterium pullorum subsp. gallinarum]
MLIKITLYSKYYKQTSPIINNMLYYITYKSVPIEMNLATTTNHSILSHLLLRRIKQAYLTNIPFFPI